jgi:hypothetical protein
MKMLVLSACVLVLLLVGLVFFRRMHELLAGRSRRLDLAQDEDQSSGSEGNR